jgi:hypothetical protein
MIHVAESTLLNKLGKQQRTNACIFLWQNVLENGRLRNHRADGMVIFTCFGNVIRTEVPHWGPLWSCYCGVSFKLIKWRECPRSKKNSVLP